MSVTLERSFEIVTFISEGKPVFFKFATIFLISLEALIRFLPPLLITFSKIAFSPKERAYDVASFSLKLILAISPRYTGPPSVFTTIFSSSSGLSISPVKRMLRLCPPITIFPLEIVEFSFEIAPKISLNDTLDAVIL